MVFGDVGRPCLDCICGAQRPHRILGCHKLCAEQIACKAGLESQMPVQLSTSQEIALSIMSSIPEQVATASVATESSNTAISSLRLWGVREIRLPQAVASCSANPLAPACWLDEHVRPEKRGVWPSTQPSKGSCSKISLGLQPCPQKLVRPPVAPTLITFETDVVAALGTKP